MAEVLHGNSGNEQLNARADKSQVYGLSGNDTLASDNKNDVLLVGGSGDDKLIMSGGNGTLSGGKGSDTFEFNYSADKKLSAEIEDLNPSEDKIVVNFDGNSIPQLSSVKSGNDVVWKDSDELLNVTLKGVRENDYFDGELSEQAWEILKITNAEREAKGLSALTLSDGLTAGASIRVQEISALGESSALEDHKRPDGSSYVTVFDEVGKRYQSYGENITAGESTAADAVEDWMNSPAHRKNILDEDNQNYSKLGVGYDYFDSGSLSSRIHYWEQLFGSSLYLPAPETLDVSTAIPKVHTISTAVTLTEGNDTYSNSVFGATIAGLSGNDSISNTGLNVSISGGADNDTINNKASFVTINAGKGNDSINLNAAQEVLIQYTAGDGSDTISGLNETDTLSISGGEYTPQTVGNDVIVGVGENSITLRDAANLSLNIVGKQKNFFRGTEGADSINNTVDGAIIAALGGNDTIYNGVNNVSINAGTGDDYISSWGQNVVFFHEGGNDTIIGLSPYYNSTLKVAGGSYVSLVNNNDYFNGLILIDSDLGDSISLWGVAYDTINIVDANGKPVTVGNARDIRGTEDADNLSNTFSDATIQAFGGDDTITNNAANTSVNAGAGNDSIYNNAAQVTISGGAGNDYVNNNQQLLTVYNYSGGNDTIEGFNASDSLNIGGYSYSTVTGDDNNIIVNITGNSATVGTVTLKDYSGQYVNIVSTYAPPTVRGISISNANDSIFITGTAGNDTITNSGASVTITGGAGNDKINLGNSAAENLIQYTAGNDVITNFGTTDTLQIGDGSDTYATQTSGSDVIVRVDTGSVLLEDAASLSSSLNILGVESSSSDTIITLTEGDDTYYNDSGQYVTIRALGGNDSINTSWDNNLSIDGGAGNDTINFGGRNVTVTGGTGNDLIYDDAPIAAHVYTGGNDTIYGFDRWSTLVIADSYSTQRIGANVIIAVSGKGSITLNDYWSDLNIVSSLDDVTNYNLIYSDGDNTLLTGTSGKDYFGSWDDNVTVDAQGGGDFIDSGGMNHSLSGGDGDDTITIGSNGNATINGGAGRNIFTQWGSAGTAYVYGGGNDTIEDFNQLQTLVIADSWTSLRNENNGITTINVTGKGTITIRDWWGDINIVSSLADAKRYNTIRNRSNNANIAGTGGDDFIRNDNSSSNSTINAAGGDDVILNWGANSSINGGAGDESINNWSGGNNSTINGDAGDDTLNNYDRVSNVVLNGDAGNDYIYNNGSFVTINGGADNDDISSYGAINSSIDGGAGNDNITSGWNYDDTTFSDYSTITGGDGDDILHNSGGKNVSINGGAGNDHIINHSAEQWNDTTQQWETLSSPDNTTISGGAGNDYIDNYGASVSISGGDGSDTVWNYSDGSNVTIDGGAGNDYIDNYGSRVSINGGNGSDTVWNYGASVSINGNAGNDEIYNNGSNVSMLGGAGNDEITLSSYSRNNFVRYADGDGNDTVWGITPNDTLNLLADVSLVSSLRSGDDLIVNVSTGSVRLVGAWERPPHITIGESGTSSGKGDNGDNNSSSGRGDRGGNGGGRSSGGKSTSEGRNSDASGGKSATGSAGTGTSTGTSSGSSRRPVAVQNPISFSEMLNSLMSSNHETATVANQRIYMGGNQIISDYQSGEEIIFNEIYTGSFYDGEGNYCVGSSTGALVIQNAVDKVIDLSDAAGNDFLKAYAASTAGVIEGRGLGGFEVINGSAGADAIFAGDGGSQLWGGADSASDTLIGGRGTDIFIVSKYQGSDLIVNADSKDVVHLIDATLDDIIATEENNGAIAVAFNTGNVIGVQSSEVLSATFLLADGQAYRYNHADKSWQGA